MTTAGGQGNRTLQLAQLQRDLALVSRRAFLSFASIVRAQSVVRGGTSTLGGGQRRRSCRFATTRASRPDAMRGGVGALRAGARRAWLHGGARRAGGGIAAGDAAGGAVGHSLRRRRPAVALRRAAQHAHLSRGPPRAGWCTAWSSSATSCGCCSRRTPCRASACTSTCAAKTPPARACAGPVRLSPPLRAKCLMHCKDTRRSLRGCNGGRYSVVCLGHATCKIGAAQQGAADQAQVGRERHCAAPRGRVAPLV
eukprot:scaffold1955_cov269-Prasinococcus_capsulatus_cf.AAC.2